MKVFCLKKLMYFCDPVSKSGFIKFFKNNLSTTLRDTETF